jgi:Ras homolog gene family, member G
MTTNQVKIVFVGDGTVGKTSLILEKMNPNSSKTTGYIPSFHEDVSFKTFSNGIEIEVRLCETGGERLRTLSYPGTDLFIVCFAINDPYSFKNVKEMWFPEIHQHCPKIPKLLVGTKEDLRNDLDSINQMKEKNINFVDEEELFEMQNQIGAFSYISTSAWEHINVDEIFDECLKYHNSKNIPQEIQQKCELM